MDQLRPGSTPSAARRRRSQGFSLLEAMVALAILAFGLLAVTAGQLAALKTSRQSRSQTLAMVLAEQQLENIHRMSAGDVTALTTDPNYPNDPDNPIDPDPGDGDELRFNRRWFIQTDTPEPGVITVTVEVDWVDPNGFVRTASVESFKADL